MQDLTPIPGHFCSDGLVGEEIPLAARIIQVVDAYVAMTHAKTYRTAMPPAVALSRIEAVSGSQFDPTVVGAFGRVLSRVDVDFGPSVEEYLDVAGLQR